MLQREHTLCAYQIAVLKSLHFPEMRRRWYQITQADQLSNEWIYDRQATTFISWLENDEPDDGLYYIVGRVCSLKSCSNSSLTNAQNKAGSGKSTLMKFVFENPVTTKYLKMWAGDSVLHQASYYFWNQGTEM